MSDIAYPQAEDIGALLLNAGVLDQKEFERAQNAHAETGEPLDVIVVKLGLATEQAIATALAQVLDLYVLGPDDFATVEDHIGGISLSFLRHHRVLPLAANDGVLTLAMANPLDAYARNAMHLTTGLENAPQVARPSDILAALEQLENPDASPALSPGEANEADLRRLRDLANDAPVIRLVNQLIEKALEQQASDLHIEPQDAALRIRVRIDGILQDTPAPPAHMAPVIVSRLKIMAHLNIAEHRMPQDGRIRTTVRGRDVDIRISTIPSLHGEGAVLRILDRDQAASRLDELGFSPSSLESLQALLKKPHGIVLVTGPTGSGKTTTVYAALSLLNQPSVKILTVEDPIEYQIDGVHQVQIKPEIGLTFANVLRAFLRHDPDILMVGEIRDLETARIAVQSALTGHQVLSTLHTNDAASAITRLIDMGVEDYLLSSTLNGVVAQRLVRKLCPECREVLPALPEYAQGFGLESLQDGTPTLWRPVGCEACNGTGYRGRTSIIEVMPMTEKLAHATQNGAEATALNTAARTDGMTSLFEDGALKALNGETSLEEVLRVCGGSAHG